MKKGISVCIMFILITGCVSQGIQPEERDRSGKFDGVWDATIDVEKQHKEYGRWFYNCPKLKFYRTMYIADGQMSSSQTKKGDGYITEDGSFYVNEQHGEWRNTGGGVETMEKHYIYSGQLNNNRGEGSFVLAHGLRDYGCKGTVTLKRRGYPSVQPQPWHRSYD